MSALATSTPSTVSTPHPPSPSQNDVPSTYVSALACWMFCRSSATLSITGASYWNRNALDSYRDAASPSCGSACDTTSVTTASAPYPAGTSNENRSIENGSPASSASFPSSAMIAGVDASVRAYATAATASASLSPSPPASTTRIDATPGPVGSALASGGLTAPVGSVLEPPPSCSTDSAAGTAAARESNRTANGRAFQSNPRFWPVTTTRCPPSVDPVTCDTDRISGARTEMLAPDASDSCPRTRTTNRTAAPGRIGCVVHRICVCATEMLQLLSSLPYPSRPYDTASRKCCAVAGPKLAPLISSSCPPRGLAPPAAAAAPPNDVMAGRA